MLIQTALKEWSVAVEALANGETSLLLRKGGIKESQGKFSAQSETVVLFPTFEHQKVELLKSEYREGVAPVEPGWHPETITLKAWANITHILLTKAADKVASLADFHIWQPQLAQERLKWKASQPLYVLMLRVYRLPAPVTIPWQADYGGCRSWISLETPLSLSDSADLTAMSDEAYGQQVSAIAQILSE